MSYGRIPEQQVVLIIRIEFDAITVLCHCRRVEDFLERSRDIFEERADNELLAGNFDRLRAVLGASFR